MHGTQEVIEVARKGRPRKDRARYPSGKLKAVEGEQPWTRWRRIKDYAIKLGAHPDIGSVLGRLSICKKISDREAAAGVWIAETMGAYERFAGIPAPTTASPAYERSYRAAFGGPMGNPGRKRNETIGDYEHRVRKAEKAYKRLWKVLPEKPDPVSSFIIDLCCNDLEIPESQWQQVVPILQKVAKEVGFR